MKQRIFLYLMVLGVAMIFSAATAYSGTINLPKTEQATCYDSLGNLIACAGTGQDGEIQAGVDWPTTRFTPAGDGNCLKDELTGLIWRKKADVAGWNWEGAVGFADLYLNSSNFCGFNDWRLPNVNELESLINYGVDDPVFWLNDQGFTGVQAGPYWASTTYFGYSVGTGEYSGYKAWVVDFGAGGAIAGGPGVPQKTVDTPYIWSVRGGPDPSAPAEVAATGQTTCYDSAGNKISCTGTGQDGAIQAGVAWPSPRFTDNGNGTVTDNFTGLMWLKDANCMSYNYPTFDNDEDFYADPTFGSGYHQYDGNVSWQNALNFVAGINNAGGTAGVDYFPLCGAGYTDWRLPNIKELKSLGNYNIARGTAGTDPEAIPLAEWLMQILDGTPTLFENVEWCNITPPGTGPPYLCEDGSRGYWTSTTFMNDKDAAYVFDTWNCIIDNFLGDKNGENISPADGTTILTGQYQAVWPVRGPVPAGVCGDLDGNGQVDGTDVIVVSYLAVGLATPDQLPGCATQPPAFLCGDLDGNGQVDGTDVIVVSYLAVGLATPDQLPGCAY